MRLAVLLTVYDRLPYLPEQLKQLQKQTNQNFDLYICNNSSKDISNHRKTYKFEDVSYKNQYKMYGRFMMIRDHILPKGYDAIFTIDDDETLPVNLIDQCFRQFEQTSVRSFWAFRTFDDYWKRKRIRGSETGDYAGTGGMLSPAELWDIKQIYEAPEKYWIIDDLWLTHCILKYSTYAIKPLNVSMGFIQSEGTKATYKKIKPLKSEFHREYIIPYRKSQEK